MSEPLKLDRASKEARFGEVVDTVGVHAGSYLEEVLLLRDRDRLVIRSTQRPSGRKQVCAVAFRRLKLGLADPQLLSSLFRDSSDARRVRKLRHAVRAHARREGKESRCARITVGRRSRDRAGRGR